VAAGKRWAKEELLVTLTGCWALHWQLKPCSRPKSWVASASIVFQQPAKSLPQADVRSLALEAGMQRLKQKTLRW
jgi:hypothetical protein